MKRKIISLILLISLSVGAFAAKKSKATVFKFDFTKDFFPGVAHVVLHGKTMKNAYLTKADIMKNEYTIEKVETNALLVPVSMTVSITLQQDGSISYQYVNLKNMNDGSSMALGGLVNVAAIENDFNTLLPQVFANEEAYQAAKKKCFSEAGMIFAMIDGLTEIRAAKFSEIVKDTETNISTKVGEAKMNDNKDYPDYKYRLSTHIAGLGIITRNIYLEYYTNDDTKAVSASGDIIKVSGTIKELKKSKYTGNLVLIVLE